MAVIARQNAIQQQLVYNDGTPLMSRWQKVAGWMANRDLLNLKIAAALFVAMSKDGDRLRWEEANIFCLDVDGLSEWLEWE